MSDQLTTEKIQETVTDLRDRIFDAMEKSEANHYETDAWAEARDEHKQAVRDLDKLTNDLLFQPERRTVHSQLRTVWRSAMCANEDMVVLALDLIAATLEPQAS